MAVGGHPVRWNHYHAHSNTLNRNDPIAPGIANPGMVNGPYAMPACSLSEAG